MKKLYKILTLSVLFCFGQIEAQQPVGAETPAQHEAHEHDHGSAQEGHEGHNHGQYFHPDDSTSMMHIMVQVIWPSIDMCFMKEK